ncbi:MAG: hypothetical protein U5Q03_18750 [Bacteroidota bacterium]|nr:hypothetical protein [Bacteroidota bacterium]
MTGINDLFTFKINNSSQNKSRMKDLRLFDETAKFSKLLKLPEEEDVSRSEKIFLKKLYEYNQELKGKSFDLSIASEKLLTEFVRSHRLSKYYMKISEEY